MRLATLEPLRLWLRALTDRFLPLFFLAAAKRREDALEVSCFLGRLLTLDLDFFAELEDLTLLVLPLLVDLDALEALEDFPPASTEATWTEEAFCRLAPDPPVRAWAVRELRFLVYLAVR